MSHIHPQDQLMIHKQRHSELQAEATAHRAVNDRQRPTLGLFSRVARQPSRRATSGTLAIRNAKNGVGFSPIGRRRFARRAAT